MNTIGYLFIMVAFILIRAISRGRVENLPEDIRDTFTAIFTGDAESLKEVANRTGTGLEAAQGLTGPATDGAVAAADPSGSTAGNSLLMEMKKLGSSAQGYSLGRTGPDYYDCSGLVWRAVKNLGIYNGPRFTTHTFTVQSKSFATQVDSPAVGDIVLWQNHHMGVISGNNSFYSALSKRSGIRELSISSETKGAKVAPKYFRVYTRGGATGGHSGDGLSTVTGGGKF